MPRPPARSASNLGDQEEPKAWNPGPWGGHEQRLSIWKMQLYSLGSSLLCA